jgi:putative ABC transport system ATP-binding protein
MQRAASEKVTPGVVKMSGVRFRWRGPKAFSLAIDDFALRPRERVLLVGPSGSGKSTFLSLLCGIVVPAAGRVEVLGTDTARLSNAARDHFRAEHFGIIFQMFNLLPYGTVIDNVLLPLVREGGASGQARTPSGLALAGLVSTQGRSRPCGSRSVGQQRRVAAARWSTPG